MAQKSCEFCGARGTFVPCTCGYHQVLGCDGKSACMACGKAHKRVLGPFFCTLLVSRPATRSNSPRTRLLEILHTTIVYNGKAIREKTYCLDMLRATSPFDLDAANFRGRVLDVASAIPLNAQIAKTISARSSRQAFCAASRGSKTLCVPTVRNRNSTKLLGYFQKLSKSSP
jgi:hypothetical protein